MYIREYVPVVSKECDSLPYQIFLLLDSDSVTNEEEGDGGRKRSGGGAQGRAARSSSKGTTMSSISRLLSAVSRIRILGC
jgi:hypothetical protein